MTLSPTPQMGDRRWCPDCEIFVPADIVGSILHEQIHHCSPLGGKRRAALRLPS
jgi:hypothetical protein